jgi:hypothetical protein
MDTHGEETACSRAEPLTDSHRSNPLRDGKAR